MTADAFAVADAMPSPITLHDLAAMADRDEHHRYELSAEGVLQVMAPPTAAHQLIVTRMMGWFLRNGYADEQILTTPGLYVGADNLSGGRQPDLTVWTADTVLRKAVSEYLDPAGLLLAIEIISGSSRIVDMIEKRAEYARAGVPHYWLIDHAADPQANPVVMLGLVSSEGKEAQYDQLRPAQPLAWVLNGRPSDYLPA